MQSCTFNSPSTGLQGGHVQPEGDGFTLGAQRVALSQLLQRREDGVGLLLTRVSGVTGDDRYSSSLLRRSRDRDEGADRSRSSSGSRDVEVDVHHPSRYHSETGREVNDERLRRAQSELESEVANVLMSMNSTEERLVLLSTLSQQENDRIVVTVMADRTNATCDAVDRDETLESRGHRPFLKRQSGSNQRLLHRGATSGLSEDVRRSGEALSSSDRMRSGVRADATITGRFYSPTLSVNSSSNGRRLLPD